MESFEQLAAASRAAKAAYEKFTQAQAESFAASDVFFRESGNMIAYGDNLSFMRFLETEKDLKGKIDFVSVDPPFFTGNNQQAKVRIDTGSGAAKMLTTKAYSDSTVAGMEGYLTHLAVRFMAIKDLLKDSGTLAVHLDWHAVHYVKVLLDDIFGYDNLVNELIWSYKSGGFGSRGFAKKHDTILVYAKSKDFYFKPSREKSYNRGYKPYHFKGVEEFKDELGWYTLVNRRDVLSIDMVGRSSPERTGYATQKPVKLLDILLEAFCPEGGLCADFYGGSGTLAISAGKKGMSFITCDNSPAAISTAAKRLAAAEIPFTVYSGETEDSQSLLEVDFDEPSLQISMYGQTGYTLNTCRRSLDELGLKGKARASLEQALAVNPLALADFAAAGKAENGTFTVEKLFQPTFNGRTLSIDTQPGNTHLKVWDKFGGWAIWPLDPKEKNEK